ncbi:GntR family transcriptional regulator [Castellaniella sp.]|uniref:GntR family transcriptional regulator n=1 Tax=Castellaniella sp. TaxID=1955812 RepID=UPI003568EF40
MKPLLPPLPARSTLAADALSLLKELLLSGQVVPGQRLSLRSTAQALGVSIMPVREAVHQLVADQALEVEPNRSVRVPVMSAQQYLEVTRIRLHVESYAVRCAVPYVTPALIRKLRKLNNQFATLMDAGDPHQSKAILANKTLHYTVYEAARMPVLVKLIESLWLRVGPILNYVVHSGADYPSGRTAFTYHAYLIDALEAQDSDSACAALEDDIKSAYEYIIANRYPAASQATVHRIPHDAEAALTPDAPGNP